MAWGLPNVPAQLPSTIAGWGGSGGGGLSAQSLLGALNSYNSLQDARDSAQANTILGRLGLLTNNDSGGGGGGGGGGSGIAAMLANKSLDIDENSLRQLFPYYDQLVALANSDLTNRKAQNQTQYGSSKAQAASDATARGAYTAAGTGFTFQQLLDALNQGNLSAQNQNQSDLASIAQKRNDTQAQLDKIAVQREQAAAAAASGGGGGGGGGGLSASSLSSIWNLQDQLTALQQNQEDRNFSAATTAANSGLGLGGNSASANGGWRPRSTGFKLF